MKKCLFFMVNIAFGLMVFQGSYGMPPERFGLKPIMPQQQLLAQKDALQGLVKDVWEKCLKALEVKFPGLIQEDGFDKGVLNVIWGFEKHPNTDENILFIKNTVQSVITKTQMPFMRFDKKTKATQEQALKWMLERMMGNALVELLLQDVSESLYWCTCTAEYKRITLAVLVVNEVREKYPDKNQRIVYTSFASGNLMQDYVILSELLVSHTNVLVNLIDLEYPDIPALAKKDLDIRNPHDLHVVEMKNRQEQADIIDSFKIKMAQIVSTKQAIGTNYNFEVSVYQSAYEYIARVQKNPDEKSNILILVDPNVGSFGIADFPSLANVINVWVDQEKAPVFTLYLPRHQGVHLYELIELENKPLTVSPKAMQYLRNQLLALIASTGASKNYTPQLVQALLARTFLNEKVTDKAMARVGFPQLMQMRANVRKRAFQEGYLGDNILQSLTPIKFGDTPELLSWGTDAHISFQDLVWDALAPNAIVYQLYATDPVRLLDEDKKIIKVSPEVYKKSDVITPNSGKASSVKEEEPTSDFSESEEESEEIEEQYLGPKGLYKRIL